MKFQLAIIGGGPAGYTYIGTWIETDGNLKDGLTVCRTLYRYVD